ncbi:MAG: sigma-70 family RNA polymerase sigma factor [Verrucomicrobiota bacterium]|nr:sigma-70 family RNA polymerase sigma factor [Verrucomicrobiota bacterium]
MNREQAIRDAFACQGMLLAYAYGIVRDWRTAEDVVQDALVVVVEQWQDFKSGTSMLAWVKTIARNKAFHALRARNREKVMENEQLNALVEQAMDAHLNEERMAWHERMTEALDKCMDRLGERTFDMVKGFYLQSQSYENLARSLQVSVEAVRKSLLRARNILRDCVRGSLTMERAT